MATLNTIIMLIAILVSILRLCVVINVKKKLKIGFKGVLLSVIVLSLFIQLPITISHTIIKLPDGKNSSVTRWEVQSTSIGRSYLLKSMHFAVFCFRALFVPILMLIINVTMLVKYKARLNKKLAMKSIGEGKNSLENTLYYIE